MSVLLVCTIYMYTLCWTGILQRPHRQVGANCNTSDVYLTGPVVETLPTHHQPIWTEVFCGIPQSFQVHVGVVVLNSFTGISPSCSLIHYYPNHYGLYRRGVRQHLYTNTNGRHEIFFWYEAKQTHKLKCVYLHSSCLSLSRCDCIWNLKVT